jgi:hypothetical protein
MKRTELTDVLFGYAGFISETIVWIAMKFCIIISRGKLVYEFNLG